MRRLHLDSPRIGISLSVCLVLCSYVSFAQISPNRTNNTDASYKLSGSVVNSVTGEPIARALVTLYSRGERLAFTNNNGQFEIDGLESGETTLMARKPGYFDEAEAAGSPSSSPLTTIGPDSPSALLKLVPQNVIFGRVQTSNGEPIEAIPVKVMAARIVDGRRRWQQAGEASTDEDGVFRIAHLRPDSYYIEVGPSKELGDASSSDRGYPAMFYPSASDITSASAFDLKPGQQAEADVSLNSVRLFKVSGRLAGYLPGNGISFEFVDHLGNHFSFLKEFHPDSGEFVAEVPAGSYVLRVNDWIPNASPARAEAVLNVTSDVSGVYVTLGSMLPVPILVRNERTKPDDLRQLRPDNGPLVSIRLISDDNTFETVEAGSAWLPHQNPWLVIPDVSPGRYSVQVIPSSGSSYVLSAQSGSTDLLNDELTISAGVQPAPIDVVLRDDGATLTIQLRKGASSSNVRLLVVPDHRSATQIKSLYIGSQEEFSIPNLAPGDYSVVAINGGDVEYSNPEVLDQYLSRATHVSLEQNGRQEITLDSINVPN